MLDKELKDVWKTDLQKELKRKLRDEIKDALNKEVTTKVRKEMGDMGSLPRKKGKGRSHQRVVGPQFGNETMAHHQITDLASIILRIELLASPTPH